MQKTKFFRLITGIISVMILFLCGYHSGKTTKMAQAVNTCAFLRLYSAEALNNPGTTCFNQYGAGYKPITQNGSMMQTSEGSAPYYRDKWWAGACILDTDP